MIKVGIDASNIRAGGGLTHLSQLITYADPQIAGIAEVIIWGGDQLNQLPDRPWLTKENLPILNKSLLYRVYWQKLKLTNLAKQKCDVLFAPAGNYTGSFLPFVSMSQNMLVFESKERKRYGFSWTNIRLRILKRVQTDSFTKSSSVIFISKYAETYILNKLKIKKEHTVIHHGISRDFVKPPASQIKISQYSRKNPFKLLYVSIVDVYKHQTELVKAVERLYNENYPIELYLVGPSYGPYLKRLKDILGSIENSDQYIKLKGKIPFEEISEIYKSADAFVFCSSCENMPNIVIEAMSSGLPIASSNYGPMPEFLKDSAFYFDPVSVDSTYKALKELLNNTEERQSKAKLAFEYSKNYNWNRCAKETFDYLKNVALKYKN